MMLIFSITECLFLIVYCPLINPFCTLLSGLIATAPVVVFQQDEQGQQSIAYTSPPSQGTFIPSQSDTLVAYFEASSSPERIIS